MISMVKKFNIGYGVVLDKPYNTIVYKAVSHRHAAAMALKVIPSYKDYFDRRVEVYEWLKPFTSRRLELIDEDLQCIIKRGYNTRRSIMEASLNRVW